MTSLWSNLNQSDQDELWSLMKRANVYIAHMSIKEKDRPKDGPSDLPDEDWIRMNELWWRMWT